MPRRTNRPYSIRALHQLTRGLLFTPADKRPQQVRRAERLHDEIDPNVNYPLEYITYRITHFRSTYDDHPLLVGQAILPDLRQMIDELSRSVDLPAEPINPAQPHDPITYLTAQQLADQWHVSTKTITRYRAIGLRWRWMPNPETGRRVVVYPSDAVDNFLAHHADLVSHAARYAYLDDATRQRIIHRATRIAHARGVTLNQVATHLAKRTHYSLDSVRKTLEAHDQQHRDNPDKIIFTNRSHPLTARQKRFVERAANFGIPTARIARHLNRTRVSIHRLINQQRATQLQRITIAYHTLPIFQRDDADTIILDTPLPQPDAPSPHTPNSMHDIPASLHPAYTAKTYTPTATQTMFVRMHYHRYRADHIRQNLHPEHPRTAQLQAIEHHLQQADHCREQIILAHMPFILTAARQHNVGSNQPLHLIDLLEIAHPILYTAVDTFDPTTRAHNFRAFFNYELQRRFARIDTRAARKREPDQTIANRILQHTQSSNITLPPHVSLA